MFNIVMMLFYIYNLIVRGGGFELLNVSIKNSKEYRVIRVLTLLLLRGLHIFLVKIIQEI